MEAATYRSIRKYNFNEEFLISRRLATRDDANGN